MHTPVTHSARHTRTQPARHIQPAIHAHTHHVWYPPRLCIMVTSACWNRPLTVPVCAPAHPTKSFLFVLFFMFSAWKLTKMSTYVWSFSRFAKQTYLSLQVPSWVWFVLTVNFSTSSTTATASVPCWTCRCSARRERSRGTPSSTSPARSEPVTCLTPSGMQCSPSVTNSFSTKFCWRQSDPAYPTTTIPAPRSTGFHLYS